MLIFFTATGKLSSALKAGNTVPKPPDPIGVLQWHAYFSRNSCSCCWKYACHSAILKLIKGTIKFKICKNYLFSRVL